MTVCYDLRIDKGVDFNFEFRLRSDGEYLNPSLVTFKASSTIGGAAVVSKSTSGSNGITIDTADNYLITVSLTEAETDALTSAKLYYEIDAVISGVSYRKLIGYIKVYEGIS